MKTHITVFDPQIARKLIKKGFGVADIKPDRENKIKTNFIFENTDEFKKEFNVLLKSKK